MLYFNLVLKGDSYRCVFTRLYIFNCWCKEKGTNAEKLQKALDHVQCCIENIGFVPEMSGLTKCVGYICKKIAAFWIQYKRKQANVLQYKSDWLKATESISIERTERRPQKTGERAKRGRPKGDFLDSSKRTKRRRIAALSKCDESTASALRSSNNQKKRMCTKAVVDEVLALLIEAKMSKHQYGLIEKFINSKLSFNFLPSYNLLLKAKASS